MGQDVGKCSYHDPIKKLTVGKKQLTKLCLCQLPICQLSPLGIHIQSNKPFPWPSLKRNGYYFPLQS